MTVTLTAAAVGIVFVVYLLVRLFARSWVSTGSAIDRILADVTATPAAPVARPGSVRVSR